MSTSQARLAEEQRLRAASNLMSAQGRATATRGFAAAQAAQSSFINVRSAETELQRATMTSDAASKS